MTVDEIVSGLLESLDKAANADPRLLAAFDRDQCSEALLQGMAIEGHVDFAELKSLLLAKGAPEDVMRGLMLQLNAEATNKGLTVIEGLFQDPAAETVIAADGFLPAAELKKEKELVDNALVGLVVRNDDLHVDMEEFRRVMSTALDAALHTGDVDLEPIAQFLASTDTPETARNETLLTLVQLTRQGKTRYKLSAPSSLAGLSEADQTAILEAFNKRCPAKEAPPPSQVKPKQEEKKPQQPAFVPPGKQKPKKKGHGWLIFAAMVLAVGAGVAVWRVAPKASFKPANNLVLPPDAMPCTQLLSDGNQLFCGLKVAAWGQLSNRPVDEVAAMKERTRAAAIAGGFKAVTFGIDTSKK